MPEDGDASADVAAAHDLATTLRNDGYTVGFDTDDVVEDFGQYVDAGQELLEADDLGGYFVVAHRDGQTDYSSSVVVRDPVVHGVTQIQMLGAHFRAVLEALPMESTELIDAMVDEAITVDDNGDPRED